MWIQAVELEVNMSFLDEIDIDKMKENTKLSIEEINEEILDMEISICRLKSQIIEDEAYIINLKQVLAYKHMYGNLK